MLPGACASSLRSEPLASWHRQLSDTETESSVSARRRLSRWSNSVSCTQTTQSHTPDVRCSAERLPSGFGHGACEHVRVR
jgi:hypothetical protein